MKTLDHDEQKAFQDAVQGLMAGDFSRLEPLFVDRPHVNGQHCVIIEWYEAGLFTNERQALAEALACACFNGRTKVVEYLLAQGVDPLAGSNTGLDSVHWAVNRGQLDVVMMLIDRQAPLETVNMHGTTVLGTAVWSAIYEPRPNHIRIIEALIKAGAQTSGVGYPSGNQLVDEVFRRASAAS